MERITRLRKKEDRMETEDAADVIEEESHPGSSGSIPDLTPSSPRPVRDPAVQSQNPVEDDLVAPSVPTGIRIDNNKIMQWNNDLVRFTEGFVVEKLERIYSSMAQVIRRYRTLTDRTDLPTDLQAELEIVKTQERDFGQRQRDNEFLRQQRR